MISLNSLHWKIIYDDPLTMVYRPCYPWYFNPPCLPIVSWPPYWWYIDTPPMVFWLPAYGISTPYWWYIEHPTHGTYISMPLSMVFWPPTHGILIPYPWYIDPYIHGIFTPLPMAYRTPYSWYFDPLPISWLEMRGVNIPWGFNLPYRGVKIPYDTGPFFIHELSPDL